MNAPSSGLRALANYLVFDIRTALTSRSLWTTMVTAPLVIGGMMALMSAVADALPSGDSMEPSVAVLTDVPHADELLADLGWPVHPADGTATADVTVRLYGLTPGVPLFDLEVSDAAPPFSDDAVRWQLAAALEDAVLRERIGEQPPLPWTDPDPLPELAEISGPLRWAGTTMLFLALMFGSSLGTALLESMRSGFNSLLALGTSRRVILLNELMIGMLVQILQASVGWLVLLVATTSLGLFTSTTLPGVGETLSVLPMLTLLSLLTLLPVVGLSLTIVALLEDASTEVRERLTGLVATLMLLVVFATGVSDGLQGWMLVFAAVPGAGTLALWPLWLAGAPVAWPLLAWHGLVAVAALRVAAFMLFLNESPLTWWGGRQH